MEILLFIISLVIFIVANLNILFNGKYKYWEIFTLIPTWFIEILIICLIIFSFLTSSFSIILLIFSFILFLPYLDFSFFIQFKNLNEYKTIKFLDWNTLYFHPTNPKLTSDLINNKKPDIIFIQELFQIDEKIKGKSFIKNLKDFEDPVGYLDKEFLQVHFPNYEYITTSFDKGIISKYPLEIIKEYSINNKFGYMIAKVKIYSHELYLFNVHLPYSPDFTFGFDEKKYSFQELKKDLERYRDKKIILSGDFNATKSSGFIREIFNILNEAVSENNFGYHSSWSSKLPFWRLDFLFYNKSSNFIFTKAKFFSDKKLSDHKGIEGEFIILENKKDQALRFKNLIC